MIRGIIISKIINTIYICNISMPPAYGFIIRDLKIDTLICFSYTKCLLININLFTGFFRISTGIFPIFSVTFVRTTVSSSSGSILFVCLVSDSLPISSFLRRASFSCFQLLYNFFLLHILHASLLLLHAFLLPWQLLLPLPIVQIPLMLF